MCLVFSTFHSDSVFLSPSYLHILLLLLLEPLPGVHQLRTQDDISLFLVLLVELQILKYKYKFVVNGGQGFEKFIL